MAQAWSLQLADAQRMMFVGMAAAREAAKGKKQTADIRKIRPIGENPQMGLSAKKPPAVVAVVVSCDV